MNDSFNFPVAKIAGGAVATFFILGVAFGSWFTVEPTERAAVRTFGTVQSTGPIGPGLHFKMPFVSSVDKIQVSQQNLHVEPFKVNTIDNQQVEMEVNITYDIPDSAVFHLMYEVGKSGSTDIHGNLIPIIQDRVSRIVSVKNTNNISEQREAIQAEITKSVEDSLTDLFKIHVRSLQIARIGYSQAFVDSNNNAVLAKNLAVQEENKLKVVQYQAQQKVISAQGEAQQAVAGAEGAAKAMIAKAEALNKSTILQAQADNQATILKAQAEKQALQLRGEGESSRLAAEAGALGGPERYIALQQTKAYQNWNGSVPTTQISAGSGTPFVFTLPQINGNK